jgi:hypothetical protein
MGDWVDVGRVVKLQVQRGLLRRGPVYGTGNLAEVSVLRLTPDGPIGFDGSSWIVDRHHRAHPASARYDPARALSIGFTSHYEYIWGRFDPIPLGSAGENLIVETDRLISLPDLEGGIRIHNSEASVAIATSAVAEPCVPFTRFATGRHDARADEIVEERNQLRRGIRGFVMAVDGIDNFDISPGARVSVRTG